jgi:hypothetical protein
MGRDGGLCATRARWKRSRLATSTSAATCARFSSAVVRRRETMPAAGRKHGSACARPFAGYKAGADYVGTLGVSGAAGGAPAFPISSRM